MARWAPSAYNEQPWRFIYTEKGSPNWSKLLSALIEFNQDWAKEAAVLVLTSKITNMSVRKQTIKLKEEDLKKIKIKSLKQSVWEMKQGGRMLSEQIHQNPKHKKPKYPEEYKSLED